MLTGQVPLSARDEKILATAFKPNGTLGPITGLGAVLSLLSLAYERGGYERQLSEALLTSIFSHKYGLTPPFPGDSKESPSPSPQLGPQKSKTSRFDKLFSDETQGPVQGGTRHHSVGSTSDERLDSGKGQLPQAKPSSFTGPPKRSEGGTQQTGGPRFKLTPPDNGRPVRADGVRPAPKAQIPGEAFTVMYALCYGAKTALDRRLLTKTQTGRVAGVLRKLTDAGADVSRLGEFRTWWFSWAKIHPSPEKVQEFWLRAMNEIDEANRPPEKVARYSPQDTSYTLDDEALAELEARAARGRAIMKEGR